MIRRLLAALIALGSMLAAAPAAGAALPPVKHVFIVVLENESESTSFGPGAPSPYLAQTLPSMGVFVPNYFAVGHNSLDNYIAMISGQAPNPMTEDDCNGMYTDWTPPGGGGLGSNGQETGTGCVYPTEVKTLADQLTAAGDTWKGYMQSMPTPCSHATLNGTDPEQGEGAGADANDTYATRHDPFMWFHTIIDDNASCQAHVVGLNALQSDLSSASTTPNLSFITPDVCSDGHDSTCHNPSEPAGFSGINAFLSTYVPMITGSPAFKQDGLLIVTFDEASSSDTSSCCGEVGTGGGDVGAVLVSPFITPGSKSTMSYNHYSMLASIEDVFGLSHVGDAQEAGTTTFGSDIYNLMSAPAPAPTPVPTPTPTPTPTPAPTIPKPTLVCPSGRSVTIHLPTGRKRLRSALVKVNGRKAKFIGGKKPRVVVSLVGRSQSKVSVLITGRQGRRRYRAAHHYTACHTG